MTDGSQRQVETLRYGWKFTREEAPGVTEPDFDDPGWQKIRGQVFILYLRLDRWGRVG